MQAAGPVRSALTRTPLRAPTTNLGPGAIRWPARGRAPAPPAPRTSLAGRSPGPAHRAGRRTLGRGARGRRGRGAGARRGAAAPAHHPLRGAERGSRRRGPGVGSGAGGRLAAAQALLRRRAPAAPRAAPGGERARDGGRLDAGHPRGGRLPAGRGRRRLLRPRVARRLPLPPAHRLVHAHPAAARGLAPVPLPGAHEQPRAGGHLVHRGPGRAPLAPHLGRRHAAPGRGAAALAREPRRQGAREGERPRLRHPAPGGRRGEREARVDAPGPLPAGGRGRRLAPTLRPAQREARPRRRGTRALRTHDGSVGAPARGLARLAADRAGAAGSACTWTGTRAARARCAGRARA